MEDGVLSVDTANAVEAIPANYAAIDGLTQTSYTVPQGYHSGSGTVSLTGDIEEALAAI
ncbi:MAG TPA: hypothetical protein H9714_06540 [Candidatus Flavonifractor intestinipullorum]|uniref:Uncharacterized protein n=1 Tax=Candidatus Flavonifractor intestinipullorum TaxID=2838587 RepID=A0A9D2S505_9FIRM|nr:hypothetical protein [Candidatus Flavonifractor intestinipullorum]